MSNSFKNKVWAVYAALIVTAAVFIWTGLIPAWGQWYSSGLSLRCQTEVMMRGHIALASDPSALDPDQVWDNGKVQHVWGLAVPAWRLPFEWLAKLFGQRGFPDRLVFAFMLAAVAYLAARFHLDFSRQDAGLGGPLLGIIGIPTLLFWPPFLALCRTSFSVYEEVVAYGYLASILLMIWLSRLWLRPKSMSFLLLAIACGFTPFIRATTGVYGAVTMALAAVVIWRAKRDFCILCAGVASYASGIALLLYCNWARFGSCLEFGYSLNLTTSSSMDYAQRFESPYHSTPILSAARELFGVLFLSGPAVKGNSYGFNRFPGQAHEFRWRYLYFSTYDLTVCIMILTAWAWLSWRLYRWYWRKEGFDQSGLLAVIASWSVLSSIPLIGFYLRFPFMASRYLLDFGPSFATACTVLLCVYCGHLSRLARWKSWIRHSCVLTLVAGWWATEVATAQVRGEAGRVMRIEEVTTTMAGFKLRPAASIPRVYEKGCVFKDTGIRFNGTGWNSEVGTTKACVSLFVQDPNCLVLEVEPAVANPPKEAYDCIRVKIGLEFLKRTGITFTATGATIRFEGPTRRRYQTGIQLASLAMMSTQELNSGESKFLLRSVSWHTNN